MPKINAEKGPSPSAPDTDHSRRRKRTITALVLFLFTAIFGLSIFNAAGPAGIFIIKFTRIILGIGAYILPVAFLGMGLIKLRHRDTATHWSETVAGIVMAVASLGLFETIQKLLPKFPGGGLIGELPSGALIKLFDPALTIIILVMLIIISSVFAFQFTLQVPSFRELLAKLFTRREPYEEDESSEKKKKKVKVTGTGDEDKEIEIADTKNTPAPVVTGMTDDKSKKEKKESKEESIVMAIGAGLPSTYTPPPLSLLSKSKGNPGVGNIKTNAEIIQHTLANFNIEVTMDEITVGPSVTRYAMKPAVGTKLSRINGLENELSLALAAHPIRIEAPIPGKSLVGIEIPNQEKTMIGLASMLEESEFVNTKKPLLISIGKSISGKAFFADIAKMPHAMIAGTTGSGKSVTVHNIILSLLYAHGPQDVRMIMVDPKRVELTLYDGIPHLLTPVIKEAKKALLALKWATVEMDRRYNVLEEYKVRDIQSYHASVVAPAYAKASKSASAPEGSGETMPERMPYIVIIIDEMADLMQLYPRELEAAIVRLAQMSRAVGIHLILSTQRPSVNVITGLIKANIPTRIALKVSSQIDSRTILDSAGAETLLGMGDTLYRAGDMPEPERIQCAFVPEEEIREVAKFIIKHNRSEVADTIELPDTVDEDRSIASGNFGDDGDADDPLFEEVREMVIKSGKASTSYIQRKFRIGYSRAARLMDMLEEAGVIGPGQGSKPRDVLIQSSDTSNTSTQNSLDFEGESEDEEGEDEI